MIYRVQKGLRIHAVDSVIRDRTLCGEPSQGRRVKLPVAVTCDGCVEVLAGPRFVLCETVTAASLSVLHVRILSGRGMQVSGSADTPALCGREVEWDVAGQPDDETLRNDVCPNCLAIWRRATRRLGR